MDRSRSVLEKLAKSVDKTLLKHASKSQRALEGIEARAAARAAAERGGSAIPITQSTRKQLDQVANIRSVLSLSETP
jgi:glycerol-3-phosphate dehydrogenase